MFSDSTNSPIRRSQVVVVAVGAILMFAISLFARGPWLTVFWSANAYVADSIETVYGLFSSGAWRQLDLDGELPPWLLPARLGSHFVTGLAAAFVTFHAFRDIHRRAGGAVVLALGAAALAFLLPGPLYYFSLPFSREATGVMWFALLLLTELHIWQAKSARRWLIGVHAVVLVFGGASGAYFLIGAALVLAARGLFVAFRGNRQLWIVCGVALLIGASIRLIRADRLVLGGTVLNPLSWHERLSASYGLVLAALYPIATVALLGLAAVVALERLRKTEADRPLQMATALALVVAVHPLIHGWLWARGPVSGASSMLTLLPIALVTLIWVPALMIHRFAPEFGQLAVVGFESARTRRRWSLDVMSVAVLLLVGACVSMEWPRRQGLFPSPGRLGVFGSDSFSYPPSLGRHLNLLDYRIDVLDTERLRLWIMFSVEGNPKADWLVELRGYVEDEDVPRLPDHQRDQGYAEWVWQPSPGTSTWSDLVLCSFDVAADPSIQYDMRLRLCRTDAKGPGTPAKLVDGELHLGKIRPTDQFTVAALNNPGFEAWFYDERHPNGWVSDVAGRRTPDTRVAGGSVLEVGPGYAYNNTVQTVKSAFGLARRDITFSASAKTSDSDSVYLVIEVGGAKHRSYRHPGDGEWRRLFVEAAVPASSVAKEFKVYLVHGNAPKGPCWFDDAELRVK